MLDSPSGRLKDLMVEPCEEQKLPILQAELCSCPKF